MRYIVEATKREAGKRRLLITEDMAMHWQH